MSEDIHQHSIDRPIADKWGLASVTRLLSSVWRSLTRWHPQVIAHLFVAALATLLVVYLVDRGLPYGAVLSGVGAALLLYLIPLRVRPRPATELAARRSRADADRALLRELINGMPEAAIIINPEGIVIHHNDMAMSFCSMIKRGRHISTCIRNPNFLDAIAAAGETDGLQSVFFNQRIPVEQRIEATVAGIRTAGANAAPAYMLISLRDLSEQENLARMRADFIANASHELRTPLASLQGFIETLQGPARNDVQAREKFLNIMAQQSKRMTRLIDDLLSLSRVEMKAHLFPDTRLELIELVVHVIETLEPLASERHITIEYATPDFKIPVRGDRDELVQVFQNLIQNAIKYGHDGGHIHVSYAIASDKSGDMRKAQVVVKDDGPGIAPEHLPRLVERFYRVDVADSRHKGGTGLGLAIVKHVLNRHRGELKVASALGKGATFTVELPLLPDLTPVNSD